mgnify:CR=1 FL=1
MSKHEQDERRVEALKQLRKLLKPGSTVYTVLRHVAKSGMTRWIDLYVIKGNEPVWITGYAGQALGTPQSRSDWEKSRGLRVGGCGMDMGFHLVYNLSRVMFPDGFVPSKAGRYGRNGASADQLDKDGGYALNHKWL